MNEIIFKALELFLSYVILRGIVVPIVVDRFKRLILLPSADMVKNHLLRTERDVAIWLHHMNRAYDKGHDHRHVTHCNEGDCKKL